MTRRMKWMTVAAVLTQLLVYPSIYVVLFYVTSERLHSLSKPLIRELAVAIKTITNYPFVCDRAESVEGQPQNGILTARGMRKFDERILYADADLLHAATSTEIAGFTHAVFALDLDIASGVLHMYRVASEVNHSEVNYSSKNDYWEICDQAQYADTEAARREIAEASQVAIQKHKAKLADFLERFQAAAAEHASRRWAIAAIAWFDILFEIAGFTCGVLVIRQWRRDRKAKRASAGQTGAGV